MKIFVAVVALVTVFVLGVAPQASAQMKEGTLLEGTWKLVMRKLADGTTVAPPTAQGNATYRDGLRSLIVIGSTPAGKPWCLSLVSNYKISGTEWSETLLLRVYDDGSGKPPTYDLTGASKATRITREGARMTFHPAFEPVTYAFEGDKWTATLPGVFVDYWERVR
jgi:hypothetical protein